jgi:hypothetical protein
MIDRMMPTLREILVTNRYDTDKSEEYLLSYERCFAGFRTAPIALMEIGVHKGGSLLMWRDYFLLGSIVGVDKDPPSELGDETGRIRLFQCDQADAQCVDAIAREASPTGFHVIIDDASHLASLTAIAFRTLFYKPLRPGGFYAIEDWGTGYWDCWPDGSLPERLADEPRFESDGNQFPSHQSGMVGFVKQLIDECGLTDVYHPRFGVPGNRKSYIRTMHVSRGLVIIEKVV